MVSVVMIVDLAEIDAPPPGLVWLQQTAYDFFNVNQVIFTATLLIVVEMGAGVGVVLSNSLRRAARKAAA